MSPVAFREVTKTFGETVAVDSLDLIVPEGEFLVVLGPSGCGKSTALRLLAGLETPDAGLIEIGGQVVNEIEPRNRDVAMVFQSYALYPHMTVAANIESPLIGRRVPGLDRAGRTELVQGAARMLGLEDLLERKPGQLSGGQRQRVALARAIVRQPAVFCMDEPLSNLDAKLRAQTRAELVDLHGRLDSTFVYVTHDQAEAMSMATTIAVLDEGRLQQLGTPRQIYEEPANLFVARFIGSPPMNILPGTVRVSTNGRRSVTVAGGELDLAEDTGGPGDGTEVKVGMRPEHIRVGHGGIAAEIRSVEWLGHEQIVTVAVAGAHLVVRAPDDQTLGPGSTCGLDCPATRIHLFDPESELRITRAGG